MSAFPYNEIAGLLIDDSMMISPNDPGGPEQTADAIMAALSLTQLRDFVVLHLTIDMAQGRGD